MIDDSQDTANNPPEGWIADHHPASDTFTPAGQIDYAAGEVADRELPADLPTFKTPVKNPFETGTPSLTDAGNAQRFAAQHGKDIRYCHPWKKWLCWDQQRWPQDDSGQTVRMAKATARSIHVEASHVGKEHQKQITRWAMNTQSKPRLDAMTALAQSEDGIPVSPDDLDAKPLLLNTSNLTVDLRQDV